MQIFELTMPGFDAATDETDDRIVWIAVDSGAGDTKLESFGQFDILETLGKYNIDRGNLALLPDMTGALESCDFVLPRDIVKFKNSLMGS